MNTHIITTSRRRKGTKTQSVQVLDATNMTVLKSFPADLDDQEEMQKTFNKALDWSNEHKKVGTDGSKI